MSAALSMPLVGRAAAIEAARGGVRAALAGQPRLILIGGEPGIGKSALAREVIAQAAALGATAGWGTCWEGSGAPAFWPWTQALRAICASDLLTGTADESANADPAGHRFRRFADVAQSLRDRRAPTALALDDLQWADPESIRLLDFLARQPDIGAVLFVGTYRDNEVDGAHPLRILLGALPSETVLLPLSGLDLSAVRDLVARELPGRELAELVHRATGGNPFFVHQVIRLYATGGDPAAVPSAVWEAVDRRIRVLPDATVAALRTASVVGAEFPIDVVGAANTLAPAEQSHLIEPAGVGRYRFAHDLIRQRLYDGIAPADRAATHLVIAESLADKPNAAESVTELAYHFGRAPLDLAGARALAYTESAAGAATARLAFDTAAQMWRQAFDLLDRMGQAATAAQLLAAGDAYWRVADVASARQRYLAVAARQPSPDELALAALGLHRIGGAVAIMSGIWETVEYLERAVVAQGHQPPSGLAARTMAALARELADGPRRQPDRAADLAQAAVEMARGCEDQAALAFCLFAQHDVVWAPGTAAQRLQLSAEMAAAAVAGGAMDLEFEAQFCQLIAYSELGDPDFSRALRQAELLATELRLPRPAYLVESRKATQATIIGRFDEAKALAAAAAACGHRINEPDATGVEATQRCAVSLHTDIDAFADTLTAQFGDLWFPPEFAPEQAALRMLAAGDRVGAATIVASLPNSLERSLFRWRALAASVIDVEIAVAAGAEEACANRYEELLPFADKFVVIGGCSAILGPVALFLGIAARAAGRIDEAAHFLRDALDRAGRFGSPPMAARARSELAVVLARSRPAQAQALIDDAEPVAAALGLAPAIKAIARARSLLGGVGPTFRHDRDGWLIALNGNEIRLRDAKGLQDLATLVANPGQEIAATTLLGASAAEPAGGADDQLDPAARAAYRRRLGELDGELAEADRTGDPARSARATAERDAIVAALKGAYGLGGRIRRLGDAGEKARTTVTARIRDSLRRIAEADPAIGLHLQQCVRTGRTCAYQPPSHSV